MRAAHLHGAGDLRVVDVPAPTIEAADEVLIRIHACGICPSDLRRYQASGRRRGQLPHSLIPGHEWAGEVLEVGPEVHDFHRGDRVVPSWRVTCGRCFFCGQGLFNYCENTAHERIRGGFCEYGVAPTSALYRIPDNVSYQEATFTEPLACCINGMQMSNVQLGDDVLIIGGGPIGLLHVQLARLFGARVLLSEPIAERRELAKQLGAHETFDPSASDVEQRIQEATSAKGPQATIVAVGVAQAQQQALQWTAACGTVNFFAGVYPAQKIALDSNLVHYKQLIVTGSHDYTPHHFRTALKLIRFGMVHVAPLISHVVALEDVEDGFRIVARREGLKVLVSTSP